MLWLPACSTRPYPIDWLLSGVQIKANFVAGQTRSPRRSSWHRRPKFAFLLFSKVYQAWPKDSLCYGHSVTRVHCPARCACACHGVSSTPAGAVAGGGGVVFVCVYRWSVVYMVLGNQDRWVFAFLSVINHSSRQVCARAWFVQRLYLMS